MKQPRILLVGPMEGWMGIHLLHFAGGFKKLEVNIRCGNYREWAGTYNPFKKNKEAKNARYQIALKANIKEFQPDIIIFVIAELIFDFITLREYYKGMIVLYDMDGPGWGPYKTNLNWIDNIDFLLLTSYEMKRNLIHQNIPENKLGYLAHGVDTDYYHPLNLSEREIAKWGAAFSFVGRPRIRRCKYLKHLVDEDLTVWGRRWKNPDECPDISIRKCLKQRKDIIGKDVIKIYNASRIMLNMLREPLHNPPTIMSLQVFIVPSCGTCLLTEWVEELEDCFELDKELVAFKNEDEFKENAMRLAKDTELARKIGEAGRKRCLSDHTHAKRAARLIEYLK